MVSNELTKEDLPSSETEYDQFKKLAYYAWDEQNGNSLLVLNEDGTYFWYQDRDNLEDNYTKGVYMLSSGVQDHNQQYVYKDDTFYYYELFFDEDSSNRKQTRCYFNNIFSTKIDTHLN